MARTETARTDVKLAGWIRGALDHAICRRYRQGFRQHLRSLFCRLARLVLGGQDTFDEILQNTIEVLALILRDRHVSPRGIKTVRGEVAENLATDALLTMARCISDRRRAARLDPSLDDGLPDTLDEAARAGGMTRSTLVAKAATREIYDPVSLRPDRNVTRIDRGLLPAR